MSFLPLGQLVVGSVLVMIGIEHQPGGWSPGFWLGRLCCLSTTWSKVSVLVSMRLVQALFGGAGHLAGFGW